MKRGGGTKDDAGKPDLSLVPRVALEEMAKGLGYGAKKYGRYNFYQGLASSRLVAAALRHIAAYNDGEDVDAESGNKHLGHALCCLAMLLQCEKLGTLDDDRFHSEMLS